MNKPTKPVPPLCPKTINQFNLPREPKEFLSCEEKRELPFPNASISLKDFLKQNDCSVDDVRFECRSSARSHVQFDFHYRTRDPLLSYQQIKLFVLERPKFNPNFAVEKNEFDLKMANIEAEIKADEERFAREKVEFNQASIKFEEDMKLWKIEQEETIIRNAQKRIEALKGNTNVEQ